MAVSAELQFWKKGQWKYGENERLAQGVYANVYKLDLDRVLNGIDLETLVTNLNKKMGNGFAILLSNNVLALDAERLEGFADINIRAVAQIVEAASAGNSLVSAMQMPTLSSITPSTPPTAPLPYSSSASASAMPRPTPATSPLPTPPPYPPSTTPRPITPGTVIPTSVPQPVASPAFRFWTRHADLGWSFHEDLTGSNNHTVSLDTGVTLPRLQSFADSVNSRWPNLAATSGNLSSGILSLNLQILMTLTDDDIRGLGRLTGTSYSDLAKKMGLDARAITSPAPSAAPPLPSLSSGPVTPPPFPSPFSASVTPPPSAAPTLALAGVSVPAAPPLSLPDPKPLVTKFWENHYHGWELLVDAYTLKSDALDKIKIKEFVQKVNRALPGAPDLFNSFSTNILAINADRARALSQEDVLTIAEVAVDYKNLVAIMGITGARVAPAASASTSRAAASTPVSGATPLSLPSLSLPSSPSPAAPVAPAERLNRNDPARGWFTRIGQFLLSGARSILDDMETSTNRVRARKGEPEFRVAETTRQAGDAITLGGTVGLGALGAFAGPIGLAITVPLALGLGGSILTRKIQEDGIKTIPYMFDGLANLLGNLALALPRRIRQEWRAKIADNNETPLSENENSRAGKAVIEVGAVAVSGGLITGVAALLFPPLLPIAAILSGIAAYSAVHRKISQFKNNIPDPVLSDVYAEKLEEERTGGPKKAAEAKVKTKPVIKARDDDDEDSSPSLPSSSTPPLPPLAPPALPLSSKGKKPVYAPPSSSKLPPKPVEPDPWATMGGLPSREEEAASARLREMTWGRVRLDSTSTDRYPFISNMEMRDKGVTMEELQECLTIIFGDRWTLKPTADKKGWVISDITVERFSYETGVSIERGGRGG